MDGLACFGVPVWLPVCVGVGVGVDEAEVASCFGVAEADGTACLGVDEADGSACFGVPVWLPAWLPV